MTQGFAGDQAAASQGNIEHGAAALSPRPSVLFVLDRGAGHVTANIRGLIFEESLKPLGWDVDYVWREAAAAWFGRTRRFSENGIVRRASRFDIVYLLKVPSARLVHLLKKHTRAKVVFDLTDALWRPHFRDVLWQDIDLILQASDAVFCESKNSHLSAYARQRSGSVFGIPACSQTELFERVRKQLVPRADDRVVIGWIGTGGTVRALGAILGPLEELFGRHAEVDLRIVGCTDSAQLPPFKNVRYTYRGSYDEGEMMREVLGMDIGVFPPPLDIEDYEIRGALKAMIYMSGHVPPVCQNAGNCSRIITDGVNGMLASTDQEWLEKLELLVESAEMRREMGLRAFQTIEAEHSLEHVTERLDYALRQVLRGKESGAETGPNAPPATGRRSANMRAALTNTGEG